MRVFHARVKDADACVFDTQACFTRAFWAAYLRPVLYNLKLLLDHRSEIKIDFKNLEEKRAT